MPLSIGASLKRYYYGCVHLDIVAEEGVPAFLNEVAKMWGRPIRRAISAFLILWNQRTPRMRVSGSAYEKLVGGLSLPLSRSRSRMRKAGWHDKGHVQAQLSCQKEV